MNSQNTEKSRSLFGRRLLALPRGDLIVRDVVVIAALTAVCTAMHSFGWLDGFETASLDASLRLKSSTDVSEIRIVTITDADYEHTDLFNSTSPLDPKIVGAAIEAIGRANPSVVAVDLNLNPNDIPIAKFPENVPIVWATDAEFSHGSLELIGASNQETSAAGPIYGLALFPQDGDGVIRRYRRQYPSERTQFDSLPWATVRVYCRKLAQNSTRLAPKICESTEDLQPEEEFLLNFSGNRYAFAHLSLESVLEASTGDAWGRAGPLTDRIVVLGGTYRAARDDYVTPVGTRNGVEIVAQAIATEIQQSGIRDLNKGILIGLEFLGGLLIAIIHHSFSVRTALLLSLFGIPALAMFFSMATFFSLSRWANFAPVLVGTLIHQLYESAKKTD